jgi:hypothetical protein
MNDDGPQIGDVFRSSPGYYKLRIVANTERLHNGLGYLCWVQDYEGYMEEKYVWVMEPDILKHDIYS